MALAKRHCEQQLRVKVKWSLLKWRKVAKDERKCAEELLEEAAYNRLRRLLDVWKSLVMIKKVLRVRERLWRVKFIKGLKIIWADRERWRDYCKERRVKALFEAFKKNSRSEKIKRVTIK